MPAIPAGHERHAGLERDPRGAGVPAGLVPLAQPFARRVPSGNITTTWPSRQSATAVSIASLVALRRGRRESAPPARDDPAEREPEELRLGHEAQEPAREERQPERPRDRSSTSGSRRGRSRRRGTCSRPVARRRKRTLEHGPAERRRRGGRASWASAGAPSARRIRRSRREAAPRQRSLPCPADMATPPRHRRVARQGEDDRRLPRRRLRRRVEHRPHPRPARTAPSDVPKEQARARTARSASTSSTSSSRSTSSTPTRSAWSPSCKKKLTDADELLLATDEDREGEAIAWHLLEVLKPKVPVRRMVFHEITQDAIQRALERDARDRRAPRRRAGDAPHPRPALRLRGLARALEEGHAAASRPGACSRSRPGSSSSASASGWRSSPRRYWDIVGTFEPGVVRGAARRRRRQARRAGPRLRRRRHARAATSLVLDEERRAALAAALDGAAVRGAHRSTRSRTRAARPRRS